MNSSSSLWNTSVSQKQIFIPKNGGAGIRDNVVEDSKVNKISQEHKKDRSNLEQVNKEHDVAVNSKSQSSHDLQNNPRFLL